MSSYWGHDKQLRSRGKRARKYIAKKGVANDRLRENLPELEQMGQSHLHLHSKLVGSHCFPFACLPIMSFWITFETQCCFCWDPYCKAVLPLHFEF